MISGHYVFTENSSKTRIPEWQNRYSMCSYLLFMFIVTYKLRNANHKFEQQPSRRKTGNLFFLIDTVRSTSWTVSWFFNRLHFLESVVEAYLKKVCSDLHVRSIGIKNKKKLFIKRWTLWHVIKFDKWTNISNRELV